MSSAKAFAYLRVSDSLNRCNFNRSNSFSSFSTTRFWVYRYCVLSRHCLRLSFARQDAARKNG
jgi:hypothetical protein